MSNINGLQTPDVLSRIPFIDIGAGDSVAMALRELFFQLQGQLQVLRRYKTATTPPTFKQARFVDGGSATFQDPAEADSYHDKLNDVETKMAECVTLMNGIWIGCGIDLTS